MKHPLCIEVIISMHAPLSGSGGICNLEDGRRKCVQELRTGEFWEIMILFFGTSSK
jgi:hypothetical protein